MKMEGSDILKLSSSTKNTDTGGFTFGPAWLRQLSSGDSTKASMPPSPGLSVQLAKHRYGREEMLAIYESIENKPFFQKVPANLEKEFEDFFRKDLQRPVLLYAPTHEEQKFLSTCVNRQVVFNSYNKIQGKPGGDNRGERGGGGGDNRSNNSNGINNGSNSSNSRSLRNSESGGSGENSNSNRSERNLSALSRGGSNSIRGSRGGSMSGSNGDRGGGRGGDRPGSDRGSERGSISERGSGRGRGRGRGSDSQHLFKPIEEEGGRNSESTGQINNKGGPLSRKDGYTKTFYSRAHSSWDDSNSSSSTSGPSASGSNSTSTNAGASGVKKEYSRAMNEENWRNKAAANAENDSNDSKESNTNVEDKLTENEASNNEANGNNGRNWRNILEKPVGNQQTTNSNREWPTYKKSSTNNSTNILSSENKTKNSANTEAHKKSSSDFRNPEWLDDDDEENAMTFDESGKFISVKELKTKREVSEDTQSKPSNNNSNSVDLETDKTLKQKGEVEIVQELVNEAEKEENKDESSNNKLPQTSKKSSNEETKYSSQSQQQQQSLKEQQPISTNNKEEETEANLLTSQQQQLNLNSNLPVNKNEALINLQQQFLQSKFQLNEETAMKLGQLGLNEFALKNLQNAPLSDQLIIANALQNLALNNSNKNINSTLGNDLLLQQGLQQLNINKNTDPKAGAVSMDHPDAENWFYLDPQNQIQGAFSSEQMAGWLTAGYFTPNLMVKRGCDEKFLPLGVVSNNWGRIPFTSGPQPISQVHLQQQQQIQQLQQQAKQINPQQNWSKEQIIQQMQLYTQMQQLQFFPQNFNLIRNELAHQVNNNMNMAHLGATLQQLQQLQMQQKTAAASINNLGQNTVLNVMNELRSQQEALINQFNLTSNSNKLMTSTGGVGVTNDPSIVDPAILGASSATPGPTIVTNIPNKTQSIWGDIPARISPNNNNNLTPPASISPNINLIQSNQANQLAAMIAGVDSATAATILSHQLNNSGANQNQFQMLNDNMVNNKVQVLFEQKKKEEERKRKMEEEYQLKLKINEEDKRRALEEMRLKEEEQKRLIEEERVRKELQKKKLEEIIKKQEEEKRKAEEQKRLKEEELKLKQVEKQKQQKQKEELKKLELQHQHQLMQQNEENEKKRQLEQARQAELLEKQKQKLQQEQLNKLQLPAHANWANANQTAIQQQQAQQLKAILEQQELELMQQRAIQEQQKQAELLANQQSSQGGKWSSLFRGAPAPPSFTSTSPPNINSTSSISVNNNLSNPISLASIQAEQTKLESNKSQGGTTMSQKISQSQTPPKLANKIAGDQQKNSMTWAAWGNLPTASNNTASTTTSSINSTSKTVNLASDLSLSQSGNSTLTSSNNTSNNTGGFWGEPNETKKASSNGNKPHANSNNKNQSKPANNNNSNTKSNPKNQSFPDLQNSSNHSNYNNANDNSYHNHQQPEKMSKQAKKNAIVEESVQHAFLRNLTISEEFMKWCHDQLHYFHVDLHIPTFVNFLREIETCAEIEDYVINYLGDTQQAKDFAQQFFINRESQISQQSNHNDDLRDNEDSNSQFQTKGDTQFSKQRQKKRSKGQRLENQFLGFTVQPDPNLKNRGDIDPL